MMFSDSSDSIAASETLVTSTMNLLILAFCSFRSSILFCKSGILTETELSLASNCRIRAICINERFIGTEINGKIFKPSGDTIAGLNSLKNKNAPRTESLDSGNVIDVVS
ncbi:hypothetical protein OGATHE_006031 [Ogataea polymorpha]|uniref:Uncharacterized protein n=1 Tax=Ogataea polymorpha TaxID=460523 RepID=A0A9P8SXM7_9ASCO|nr:hypothetical protein OGATHE_006031 [Ogataea polymorpha]